MTDLYARYFRAFARRRSAVASVALSHPMDHDCSVCSEARAAQTTDRTAPPKTIPESGVGLEKEAEANG